jgi:signal transduction histidine kinase
MADAASQEVILPREGKLRRFFIRHGLLIDLVFVCGYFGANAFAFIVASDAEGQNALWLYRSTILRAGGFTNVAPDQLVLLDTLLFLVMVIVGVMLFFRRTHPFFALVVSAFAMLLPFGVPLAGITVACGVLLYAVPVYGTVLTAWIGYAILILTSAASFFIESGELPATFWVTGFSAALFLSVLLIGINIGNRRRYLDALVIRAQQLVLERDQRARLAVADERSRISREMHDIVAHSLSVMIALSDGATRAAKVAPEEAVQAMEQSAQTGRSALTEMRRALGALRDTTGAELVPQPGMDQFDELFRSFESAGLNIHSSVACQVEDDGLSLAVYRIVQEGLTNSLRYAGFGARVEVFVGLDSGWLTVRVRDFGTPKGLPKPRAQQGSGQGLIGVRERIRAFDGSVISEPVPGGRGWHIIALLPANDRVVPLLAQNKANVSGRKSEDSQATGQSGASTEQVEQSEGETS